MIIRYLFPVKTHLLLSEPWPLELGKYELSWRVDDNGLVSKVIVEARTNDLSALSTIKPSSKPGIAADITIGVHAERAEIEELVRTAEGVLALFCHIDIDFDGVETEWEGETDEERSRIKLYSFKHSVLKPDVNAPRNLEYDLVARSVAAASSITSYETPLSFLRKANHDLVSGRYIDAFYNYFLFLETQFAPGYSNPKQVKEKFGASPEIVTALAQARKEVEADKRRDPATASKLNALSDAEVIGLLVDLRGTLHHHAKARPNSWHPDKPAAFRTHTLLIAEISQAVALEYVVPILFADDQNKSIRRAAEKAGAITTLIVEAVACDGRELPELPISFPSRTIDIKAVAAADRHFRRVAQNLYGRHVNLRSYRITSEDRSTTYAQYSRRSH